MNLTTACDKFVHFKMVKQQRAPGTGRNLKKHITWFIRYVLVTHGDERLSRMTTDNVDAFIAQRFARVKPGSAHLTG